MKYPININTRLLAKIVMVNSLLLVSGLNCYTTQSIPFNKDDARYVNNVAILGPQQSKGINVNITGDSNIFYLLMGPAIIPQAMLAYATYASNKEEATYLNEIVFDLNIERMFREKFEEALKAYTYFHPILIDGMMDRPIIKGILNKDPMTRGDYVRIADSMGADTIAELSVLSYGVKDPGILWDPSVVLTVDARMIRARDNKTIWQTRVTENAKRRSAGFDYHLYKRDNGALLRFELEGAAEIVAKTLIKDMGFDVGDDIADLRNAVAQGVSKVVGEEMNLDPVPVQGQSNEGDLDQPIPSQPIIAPESEKTISAGHGMTTTDNGRNTNH